MKKKKKKIQLRQQRCYILTNYPQLAYCYHFPSPPPPLPLNRMVGHQKMAMLLLKFNLTVTRKGLC